MSLRDPQVARLGHANCSFDTAKLSLWDRKDLFIRALSVRATPLSFVKRPARNRLILVIVLLLLAAALAFVWFANSSLPWEQKSEPQDAQSKEFARRRAQLDAREAEADRTFWAKEMLAENCGRTIEDLWDAVNASSNKLERLAAFPIHEAVLPEWGSVQHLPHGIELRGPAPAGRIVSGTQWKELIDSLQHEGWQLDNLEFRHNQFDTDTNGLPWRSHFYFSANLTQPATPQRAMLSGDLVIDWAAKGPKKASAGVKRFDATQLQLKTRVGEPFFKPILQETISPPEGWRLIDPLIVYDLDGDGLPEIILAAKNLVYHRTGPDRYESRPLCREPLQFIMTALVADFDGDGFADLLEANPYGLFLFKGSAQGTFDEPPRQVWTANPPLKNAMVLTCGDIDGDGLLDVFLGQYKVPMLGQVLRPHYYDSNDSFPAYLLRNDGQGNFTDITEAAGLGPKRWRRVYSASLVDLNGDGRPDLSIASDFAGLDLYRNDGRGRFTDATSQWVNEPHGFGMAQAIADFNVDGRLDLMMIGMPSPTVDRLEHLHLHRPYSTEDEIRRPAMAFGNRLYVARTNGGFEQTQLSDSIARSGWSWGCGVLDVDNDGFPDVYIANGLQSGRSVREYEGEFWLHSIFLDDADDVAATHYFIQRASQTLENGWSYGGYEKNRLFLNQHGESFMDVGHLAGVALEQDSRSVVAADLDDDGRVDLVLTTWEVWPGRKQTLQIYRNNISDTGHWIGFQFREEGNGRSPVGTQVTIHYGGHSAVRQLVTGDSHRSQHPNTMHFGTGNCTKIEAAEIRWPNGEVTTLSLPAVNQYHLLSNPGKR